MSATPRPWPGCRRRCLAALVATCLLVACVPDAHAPSRPRDPALRALPVYLYPARTTPRAVVFFFGNDVGFWRAHQRLAERFVDEGYAVAGFDVRKWMEGLPDASWQVRDSAFARGIRFVMARSVAELAPAGAPVVVAGHSIGAELAIWTAAHAPPTRMVGVLALSPGSRGHLRVTLDDLANAGEPTEPGSFDVPAQLALLPHDVRVAIVRGQRDQYRYADAALAAFGGARCHHYLVPFSGHSLKDLLVAGPFIDAALAWVAPASEQRVAALLNPPRDGRT